MQLSHGVSRLTPRDINEAIEWGLNGDPVPYLLHHLGEPGRVNPVIVGAVYTPFLRVALAAKAASQAGRSFAERDVSQVLSSRLRTSPCVGTAATAATGRIL